MKFSFIIFLFSFSLNAYTQDLTGTWTGYGGMGADIEQLVVIKAGNEYIGYTFDNDRNGGYCRANFRGSFDSSGQRLKGKGVSFIERSFSHVLCIYNLKYSFENGVHYLRGNAWPKSMATRVLSFGLPVAVTLTRKSTQTDTTEFVKKYLAERKITPVKQEPAVLPEATDTATAIIETILTAKETRTADTLEVITTPEQKIKIKIFDNGVVDGDSVSIFYNDNPLVINKIVSDKPAVYEIALDLKAASHSITLVANNLGRIPPNTATLIIEAGDKNYRIDASSDFKKNAVIIINRTE